MGSMGTMGTGSDGDDDRPIGSHGAKERRNGAHVSSADGRRVAALSSSRISQGARRVLPHPSHIMIAG